LTYAYASSIIGTTLAQPSFIKYFGLDHRSNAAQLEGAINGVFQAGGLIGALLSVLVADKYGRRMGVFVASIFAILGGALQAGSVNIAMYIAMRVVSGLGVGTSNLSRSYSLPLWPILIYHSRCPHHDDAPIPGRSCGGRDTGFGGRHHWDLHWYRLCQCKLDRAWVLLCECRWSSMAHPHCNPVHSSTSPVCGNLVSARVTSLVYVPPSLPESIDLLLTKHSAVK
jgi:hypothetical protein